MQMWGSRRKAESFDSGSGSYSSSHSGIITERKTKGLSVFHSSLTKERKTYLRAISYGVLVTSIATLLILSIYWASLWRMGQYIHHLEGLIIDYDQKAIGSAVRQAFTQAAGLPSQVNWIVADSTKFRNPDQPIHLVLDEKYWIVVVVKSSATSNLKMAISSANSTYNPQDIVTVYCSESRNENAYSEFLLPQVIDAMRVANEIFNPDHLNSLAALPTDKLTALLKNSPMVVYQPLHFQVSNLRPFDVPVAAAVNFVGLIYLLIFSFILTMLNYNSQRSSGLREKLSFASLIQLRIGTPFLMYLWVSLAYCIVSLAFQVPFDRFIRGGFMIYWAMSFLAMCALGLVLEAAITILTPRFIPYFLVLWVILNVSVSLFPIPLLPKLFRYGYASPFYNVSRTVRALVFNTKNEMGINFLVQLVWILVALTSILVFELFSRKKYLSELETRNTILRFLTRNKRF